MSTLPFKPEGAFFDLDGTLLDSAPDLYACLLVLCAEHGLEPPPYDRVRPVVSRGSRAIIGAGFPGLDPEGLLKLVPRYLAIYEAGMASHTVPFDGIEAMLAGLDAAGIRWGIVTNKPEYLARLLMPLLGWESRCAVLVGGDTLPVRKPEPAPLLHAATQAGVDIRRCAYVGDDERDILSARAAGMPSVVALWGYRLHEDDPFAWQGDVLVQDPRQLCDPAAWPSP